MQKYRRKPLVYEAEQFWPEKMPWPEGVQGYEDILSEDRTFKIETLTVRYEVFPGDWVLFDPTGKRKVVNPDVFEASYEKVEE